MNQRTKNLPQRLHHRSRDGLLVGETRHELLEGSHVGERGAVRQANEVAGDGVGQACLDVCFFYFFCFFVFSFVYGIGFVLFCFCFCLFDVCGATLSLGKG